jgi:hypothetical protein
MGEEDWVGYILLMFSVDPHEFIPWVEKILGLPHLQPKTTAAVTILFIHGPANAAAIRFERQ